MKKLLIGFLVLSAFSSFASESFNNIVCQSSVGSIQAYFDAAGERPWSINIGCNPTSECAANNLAKVIATVPEIGKAAYSEAFEEYIEVSQKKVSKLTIDSSTSTTAGDNCVKGREYPRLECNRSTACASISVVYDVCDKVSYDPKTGKKVVTCPSGKVIKE